MAAIERVKFYSLSDWSTGYHIKRAEEVLHDFITEKKVEDINEIIELYNIQLFFQNKIYSRDWTKQQLEDYTRIVERFPKAIGVFFSQLSAEALDAVLSDVEFDYVEDFWQLLSRYQVYKKIPANVFCELSKNEKFCLRDVLRCKSLVEAYPNEIVLYMQENFECAKTLLSYYLEKHKSELPPLYFPDELTKEKKTEILEKYAANDLANANYLKLIFESNGVDGLPLPDKLKLRARRTYDDQMKRLSKNSVGMKYEVRVSFSAAQEEEWKLESKNRALSASYSTKWIEENLDYPTVLNNFIYLFGYTDFQFRSLHVHRKSQMGIFERFLGIKGKREYDLGVAFEQMQSLAQLQMMAYCRELQKNRIRLEDVIKWFFKEYLQKEFNVIGFGFNPSSPDASYLEKCRNIAAEIDSVLKQFKLWCEEGELDSELLHMSTEHIFIKNIPSLIKNKYIYPCGKEYEAISHLLFSDQSRIRYVPELSKGCKSFYDLMKKCKIYRHMFQEYQIRDIRWLAEQGVIYLEEDGRLTPDNRKIKIFHEFYEHEVICASYAKNCRDILEELKNRGLVEFESSLFSRPEQNYFNYCMNKSEFDNGLDLRNRYIHGTQIVDENKNEQDYYIFLRIMILIVIKINEEFCLLHPVKAQKNKV